MPSNRFRAHVIRAALLAGLAGALSARPVTAADRPATPEGAQMLRDFFGRFLPASASALVTVKAEASDYLISFDLGALNPLLKAAGARAAYEPATLVYNATEQDDGKWRVALELLAEDRLQRRRHAQQRRIHQFPPDAFDRSGDRLVSRAGRRIRIRGSSKRMPRSSIRPSTLVRSAPTRPPSSTPMVRSRPR